MFASRYPPARLERNRILRCAGNDRGVVIVTQPIPRDPAEVRHHHSVIIPMPNPRKVMVVEWTGSNVEYHDVDL